MQSAAGNGPATTSRSATPSFPRRASRSRRVRSVCARLRGSVTRTSIRPLNGQRPLRRAARARGLRAAASVRDGVDGTATRSETDGGQSARRSATASPTRTRRTMYAKIKNVPLLRALHDGADHRRDELSPTTRSSQRSGSDDPGPARASSATCPRTIPRTQTRIYGLAYCSSPINVRYTPISPAVDRVRRSLLLPRHRRRSSRRVSAQDPRGVLKTWVGKPVAGADSSASTAYVPSTKPGVFRDWEDFTRAPSKTRRTPASSTTDSFKAVCSTR